MSSFRDLPEKLRFLIYSLSIIVLPFLLLILSPLFPGILKEGLESQFEEIFSSNESYILRETEGHINRKGLIRFKDEISLKEVVKRTGEIEFGYRISEGNQGQEVVFNQDFPPVSDQNLWDLNDYLEKKPYKRVYRNNSKQNSQTYKTKKTYHDKIKENSNKSLGGKNGRKSRYY